MFHGFDFIRATINDLLIIAKGDLYNHINKLEVILKNLKDNGLKCHIKKLFFGQIEIGYLDLLVTQNGIQLVKKKLEAIINMMPPKNVKQVRAFVGLVN